jgi:hypothetical protein
MDFPRRRKQTRGVVPQDAFPMFGLQRKLLVAFTVLVLGLIISLLVVIESRYRASIEAQVERRRGPVPDDPRIRPHPARLR